MNEKNNELPNYAKQLSQPEICDSCDRYVEYKEIEYAGICYSCQSDYEKKDSGVNEAERYDL